MLRPSRVTLLTLTLPLCLAGCRDATLEPTTQPEAPPPEASMAEAPGQPNDVHWTRSSAEHKALLVQTYRMAGEVLVAKAADLEPGTWAVALDADETVIDNSQYQKERAALGLRFDSDSWAEWVKRKQAPPLPGALEFLASVHELGGKIAIVTNRRQEKCPATEANFVTYSIPFDVILCRKPKERRKEGRWQAVEEGTATEGLPPLDIVMWLGDNIRDFPDLDQDLRDEPEVAFERFGLDYFVTPNPMYGSWQDNPPN